MRAKLIVDMCGGTPQIVQIQHYKRTRQDVRAFQQDAPASTQSPLNASHQILADQLICLIQPYIQASEHVTDGCSDSESHVESESEIDCE